MNLKVEGIAQELDEEETNIALYLKGRRGRRCSYRCSYRKSEGWEEKSSGSEGVGG